ncbi:MAG: hypothetical protein HY565_04440 [Candidatus Kerfeldbacteria bacterium]|nr:hypothetical protein [Candidatus Kerfeldbacteria bacterium]
MATGLMAPVLTFAQTDYYNDYYYNDYYYNDYDYAYDSGASTALGFGMIALFGVMALVGFAFLIFQIWMIVDCMKRQFEQRTVWLVILIAGVFFGFGWIASIIYFFMVKHKNVGAAKPAGGSMPPAAK